MNALTPVAPPSLTTMTVSSPLWALLTTGPSAQLEEIARTPALREEASRSVRQLEIMAEPAGADMVKRALAPLTLVYRDSATEAESPVFWRIYADALADLPRVALGRAVADFQRTGRFFPKPAEIRELAQPHADAFRQAAYRAKRATETPAPKALPSPEDRPSAEEVAGVMARFRETMQSKDRLHQVATKRRPPPQAKVDERGVSAEARAMLQRQGFA